jgi:hypothetical protein
MNATNFNFETFEEKQLQAKYESLIASIDNSVAGTDEYGNLAWHVDCSAIANMRHSWKEAIDTANMIIDCWQDFYPQLIK